MADEHRILGVHITDRMHDAVEVQKVFTEYGCNIKTRIGLHEVAGGICAPGGVVLLEIVGDADVAGLMAARLADIHGVEVQSIVFGH